MAPVEFPSFRVTAVQGTEDVEISAELPSNVLPIWLDMFNDVAVSKGEGSALMLTDPTVSIGQISWRIAKSDMPAAKAYLRARFDYANERLKQIQTATKVTDAQRIADTFRQEKESAELQRMWDES